MPPPDTTADNSQYTDAQLSDGTTLRFKGQLTPQQVRQKVVLYRNSQPTQFEKNNSMGPVARQLNALATGALSSASGLPETTDIPKALWGGPNKTEQLAESVLNPPQKPTNTPTAYSPDQVAEQRAHDIGGVAGFLAPSAIDGALNLGRARTTQAIGKTLVDPTGRPKPIPRLIFGNERAQALGEVMNPDIADARIAAKAKQDALSAGRTAPGPWRPGIKPTPELGSPDNPGLFSPLPTKMPKPAYTPLVDSPNFNINKEKMLTGQSTPLSESPNLNINKEKALTGQSVPISQSPYYNVNQDLLKPQKPAPVDPFAGMTSTDKPIGNAALPELRGNPTPFGPPVQLVDKFAPPTAANQKSIIQSPDSPPPPRKVTYQSAAQGDLLRLVKSGDRAAIAEWDRRSLPRPPGVGYMVEDSPTLPWRNASQ